MYGIIETNRSHLYERLINLNVRMLLPRLMITITYTIVACLMSLLDNIVCVVSWLIIGVWVVDATAIDTMNYSFIHVIVVCPK